MLALTKKISQCEVCLHHLPAGVNPVVQLNANSKILIIGQAPGKKVHETGIPWNDKSGDTLRVWLNVSKEEFYDPELFSIMPMGFCYPGKGKSGDLPPRPECAPLWHKLILKKFKKPPLILLVGQYAQQYYLGDKREETLTETVKHYKDFLPEFFPLPHPSPRNQHWVKKNAWFMKKVVPELRKRVGEVLKK
jgi:uracil-DNA glycosylase family 4